MAIEKFRIVLGNGYSFEMEFDTTSTSPDGYCEALEAAVRNKVGRVRGDIEVQVWKTLQSSFTIEGEL